MEICAKHCTTHCIIFVQKPLSLTLQELAILGDEPVFYETLVDAMRIIFLSSRSRPLHRAFCLRKAPLPLAPCTTRRLTGEGCNRAFLAHGHGQ